MNLSTSRQVKAQGGAMAILLHLFGRVQGAFGNGTTNLDIGKWTFRGVWL